jgi:hypothetical protein
MPEKTDCVYYKKCELRKPDSEVVNKDKYCFCEVCIKYEIDRRKGDRRKK